MVIGFNAAQHLSKNEAGKLDVEVVSELLDGRRVLHPVVGDEHLVRDRMPSPTSSCASWAPPTIWTDTTRRELQMVV
jgi:uncharacterized protein involved in exopolysaccharide biosynthesis